jgi:hypothetical protein
VAARLPFNIAAAFSKWANGFFKARISVSFSLSLLIGADAFDVRHGW